MVSFCYEQHFLKSRLNLINSKLANVPSITLFNSRLNWGGFILSQSISIYPEFWFNGSRGAVMTSSFWYLLLLRERITHSWYCSKCTQGTQIGQIPTVLLSTNIFAIQFLWYFPECVELPIFISRQVLSWTHYPVVIFEPTPYSLSWSLADTFSAGWCPLFSDCFPCSFRSRWPMPPTPRC